MPQLLLLCKDDTNKRKMHKIFQLPVAAVILWQIFMTVCLTQCFRDSKKNCTSEAQAPTAVALGYPTQFSTLSHSLFFFNLRTRHRVSTVSNILIQFFWSRNLFEPAHSRESFPFQGYNILGQRNFNKKSFDSSFHVVTYFCINFCKDSEEWQFVPCHGEMKESST